MTILTKQFTEKPSLPLGFGVFGHKDNLEKSLLGQQYAAYHPNADAESVGYTKPQPFSCVRNSLTYLLIVIVLFLGIFGGYVIFQIFSADKPQKFHYRTYCEVPYNDVPFNLTAPRFFQQPDEFDLNFNWLWPRAKSSSSSSQYSDNSNTNNINEMMMNDNGMADFFREEIEMDVSDDESYAKIDVPDFKDGRRGRFMHDFKENQSAIIDTTANRCFVMPLDRNTTLPPKSFIDLMQKMGSGYYNIDTDRVRRNMRVATPPITDLTLISERIANECYDMKVYMMENYISGVFKREAKPITDAGKFAEYMGKGIIEFDIVNIADIEEYEKQHPK